ncbi:GDSL esterase/lipase At5g42170-like isoform X1 [Tripterygium wilfordii]|uniref:GDSL esterase/lipase At5g42170-like isoform X1 n=1 Tax=Tripterygium wilfordii TaxID=458696 RepID=UPI0018F7F8F7|nr:GDSL esterase/lipase At5g42170-like isoform X1 [Tripterygium wilfordii]
MVDPLYWIGVARYLVSILNSFAYLVRFRCAYSSASKSMEGSLGFCSYQLFIVLRYKCRCNFPLYGKDFPGGVATGRWSNGKVPTDFIAEVLGVKDTVPASGDPGLKDQDLLTGVGFASGGSGLDPHTAAVQGGSIPSIEAQLDTFKQYVVRLKGVVGEDRANQIISNSLALVSSGNNDIMFALPSQSSQLFNLFTYTDQMAVWASQFTKDLYDPQIWSVESRFL